MKSDFDTISFCNLVGMNKTQFIQRIEEVKAEKYYSKLTPMTFIKDLGERILQESRSVYSNTPHSQLCRDHKDNTKSILQETY